MLLPPLAPAVALGSPCAKEEEDGEGQEGGHDDEVEVVAAPAAEEEPAAAAATSAVLSVGLAAAVEEEEEVEAQDPEGFVGAGCGCDGLFGVPSSQSGTSASRLQSPLSPAGGGGTGASAAGEGRASAAWLDSPLAVVVPA